MLHSCLRAALLGLGLDALRQRLLNLVVLVEEGCAGSLGSTCTNTHTYHLNAVSEPTISHSTFIEMQSV